MSVTAASWCAGVEVSKVIHVSDLVHQRVKEHCELHALKMSDWVAVLINAALGANRIPARPPTPVKRAVRRLMAKHRAVEHVEAEIPSAHEAFAAYAAPPFWARAKQTSS